MDLKIARAFYIIHIYFSISFPSYWKRLDLKAIIIKEQVKFTIYLNHFKKSIDSTKSIFLTTNLSI